MIANRFPNYRTVWTSRLEYSALAGMCKIKGNPFICVVDPNVTEINRKIIELLGAEIIIASKPDQNGNYIHNRI